MPCCAGEISKPPRQTSHKTPPNIEPKRGKVKIKKMSDNLNFNCALITGGAGGLGRAMAEYLMSKGKKVILAGRTEANLITTHAALQCAAYYVLDTGDVAKIPDFVARVTRDHPDLDCLVNNAGVQRPLNVLRDDAADLLARADQEIDVNVRGPMHLAVGLLPHFRSLPAGRGALIINVSSVLGFVPFAVGNPCYNATKAWLHSWTMGLRAQLARDEDGGGGKVRVVEIAPPMVGTDLHREHDDPDNNKKHRNPMSLTVDEYMAEVAEKLERGDEMIAAGIGGPMVEKWYGAFGEQFEEAARKWEP